MHMMHTTTIVVSVALLTFTYILFKLFQPKGIRRLPPGPPARPLIGNIFEISLADGAWKTLTEYKGQYGDLVRLYGLGNNVLVLNSMQSINDLLDKRGSIYSHRPVFTVAGELMKLDQSLSLMPYGKEWREHRKLASIALSATSVKQYHLVQEDLAALFSRDLLKDPDNFFSLVRLTAARIIMIVTYGLSVSDADSKFITHAERTMELVTKSTVPGAFLCDFIPMLKYLPSWVPFQQRAKFGKEMVETLASMPFEYVKREMSKGTAPASLALDLLNTESKEEDFEHRVKWVTGTMFGAGGETTYATTLTFIMAMALHPEKQKLAQAEIDLVVGTSRMPVMADQPNLTYVNAVIKETLRWHPPLPLGVARRSGQDDTYGGYFVPKNTTVIPNIWAIAFEPNDKYDPHSYIPERFLDTSVSIADPAKYIFGFGRRICPGKWLAENSVFILISTILASFDIHPPVGEELIPEFGPDLLSYPRPFKCRIVPRSPEKAELIQRRATQSNI